ncbi:CLUMA_CG019147, isoform A [Clunio marinus]|uniref:CLUMA_CG019147, isoform A n=1 Tax=Clunio marinus TaxID=568069 RepID=A0A1J1J1I6_9DIPT|nr:CLUMA_CG019147, isoform A [Clunio marinus]
MNFLNDSLKTLKNVLEQGLEQKVDFEGTSSDSGGVPAKTASYGDEESLRKLCQHQSEEIAVLRKQIFEYQQAKLNDISINSKSVSTIMNYIGTSSSQVLKLS